MTLVLTAFLAAVASTVVGALFVVFGEVDRHDRQVTERDEDLEEWIIVRQRQLRQQWDHIAQQAAGAAVGEGDTVAAGRTAAQTLLLYDYRDELRQARGFVLRVAIEERWLHRRARQLRRRRFPALRTPDRAKRLVDVWSEGTARNALTWSLDDILAELPARATSGAQAAGDRAD